MKTSGQFQKKASTQSAPIPLSTNLLRSRSFPKPSATVEEASTDTPDFQARLEFARSHAPNLNSLAANSSGDRAPSTIQPKLTVGAPNDQYEQEADRVADQVMSTPDSATQQPVQREANLPEDELQSKAIADSITPLVQREAMLEEEELHTKAIATLQREEMPEEEESVSLQRVLRRASLTPDGNLQAGEGIESRLNQSKGGGSPLSDEVRSFMEPRFGADFSQVRVHTGGEAVQLNRDLNAQAFAHKQDVYFGAGKTPAKDALTAHELTHVVQQTGQIQSSYVNSSSVQTKCSACTEENVEVQRSPNQSVGLQSSIHQNQDLIDIQRAPIARAFKCNDYAGDAKLEACLNNLDRLRPGDRGDSVRKVQVGLERDGGISTAPDPKGVYGQATGRAVMKFKSKEEQNLGFEKFPDVGPGTMKRLDELCSSVPTPPPPLSTTPPDSEPPSTSFPPKINFWFHAFIPKFVSGARKAPAGPHAGKTVFPAPPPLSLLNSCFETDDRSFDPDPKASSRVSVEAELDTVSEQLTSRSENGLTFEIDCTTGVEKCRKIPNFLVNVELLPKPSPNESVINIFAKGNDPCVLGSPSVLIQGKIIINRATRTFSFGGSTTPYPAFEMYADFGNSPQTIFTQVPLVDSPLALFLGAVPRKDIVQF